MRDGRRSRIVGIGGLCALPLMPAQAGTEPADTTSFALQIAIEMAAHQRLVETMERSDYRPDAFLSDGCSGGLSATWDLIANTLPVFAKTHEDRPPWEHCCVSHDRAYHAAGGARTAKDSYAARLAADEALRACVRETGADRSAHLSRIYGLGAPQVTAAYGMIADAMFDAVRLGGGPCNGLPWRWGYGYPGCLFGD